MGSGEKGIRLSVVALRDRAFHAWKPGGSGLSERCAERCVETFPRNTYPVEPVISQEKVQSSSHSTRIMPFSPLSMIIDRGVCPLKRRCG
jgi:hypothetical protein